MALDLAHQVYGDPAAPPLVVLHGLFGSARNWHTLAQGWGDHQRVFAVDLRNHGQSPWDATMDYPAMAGDLQRFFQRHRLSTATLLGHSMGGKAAMAFALEHPHAVARLVVLDIAPVVYRHSHRAYIDAMAGLDLSQYQRRTAVDGALALQIPEVGIRQFLLQNLRTQDGRFSWRLNLAALAQHMDDLVDFPTDLQAKRYEGPTLFLAGEHSDYIEPAHEPAIRRLFPHAILETLPEAGHWLHAERPQAVAARVGAFLHA
ncbi:MAG: alpha/beta fold hydrolase [Candidatus Competibacterales bacterium]